MAGDRADLGLEAVADDDDGVVVEQVRDRVLVVGQVLLVGGADVLVDVLQLHEQQRDAVDEADDVRPAAVEIAPYPQLAHAEEVVVGRLVEIEDPQPALDQLALFVAERNLHAVLEQGVFLAVGGDQTLGGAVLNNLTDRVVVGVLGQAGVELHELELEIAGEHHFPVRGPAERALGTEGLLVVGVDRLPAELRRAGTRPWSAGPGCLRNRRKRPSLALLMTVYCKFTARSAGIRSIKYPLNHNS